VSTTLLRKTSAGCPEIEDQLGSLLTCSTRTKTFGAEHGSAAGWLERNRVSLAALVAGNVESLALSTWSPRATKVSSTRISAGLAAFWVSQIAFFVILLLAFGERERVSTFCTSDFKVWHDAFFSWKDKLEVSALSSFGALALACLKVSDWLVQEWPETCSGSQPNPSGIASRNDLSGLSLLHGNASIQTFIWSVFGKFGCRQIIENI
jgi:hypothetical protein